MALSEHAASLLATFSLLTATISHLISPTQQSSFLQGVKSNIWSFSPFRSGAIATTVVILLIGYRLLSLAEAHVSLMLLAFDGSPPDRGQGFWPHFARRAFLTGATLPLYVLLLAVGSDRLVQVIVTVLIAETLQAELLTFYCVTSYKVHAGWPHRLLVNEHVFPANRPMQNEGKTGGFEKGSEDGDMEPSLRDNLCDRVRQLWPSAAESDTTLATHSFFPEKNPKLRKIFDPEAPGQWTCGHWRCLLYVVLHSAVRGVWASWPLIELSSTIWVLHRELEPLTLQLAGMLLEKSPLNGILLTLYDVCTALFILIFAYIASMLLFIRLFTALFARLPRQIYILQRMQQKFQDVADAAPTIYRTIKVLLIQCLSGISSYYGALALVLRIIGLTQEKLSYIIEIITIPTIYITVYWLIYKAVGSEQAPSGSTVDPGSNQGTRDLDTTVLRSEPPDEKKDMPRAESEFPQTPKELRSAIFRLTILLSTGTIWVALCR